jgi:hypothetical protein
VPGKKVAGSYVTARLRVTTFMFFICTPWVLEDFEVTMFEWKSLQHIKREGSTFFKERTQEVEPARFVLNLRSDSLTAGWPWANFPGFSVLTCSVGMMTSYVAGLLYTHMYVVCSYATTLRIA